MLLLACAEGGHVETGQVPLPLLCCPTGYLVWAPSSHTLPHVFCKTHCSADIPKVANKRPVFPGLVCGFTLFALPVCLWLTARRCLSPSWLTWRDAGEVCQLGVPSLWLDGDAGDAAASLQPQNLSGDWSLPAAAHGSVSGIAIISIAWQACDTFIKVSDHCCTTDGWFAAALNHQGTSPSHREGAATGRGLFRRGVLRLGQGEKTRKGSCLLEGIRCSSECRAGITGSPACQAMLIGKTEGEKRSMN